ncbi:hypothetical protein JCM3770_003046 [Rhodotorula araucariae]
MSKYASLPDIDTSGADVFETADVPQEHSHTRDSDSDDDFPPRATSPSALRRAQPGSAPQSGSGDIDAERIDPGEARRRFGAATRATLDRDERREDAARRPTRRLPSAREYVAHAPASPLGDETPLERLRRLRLEMAELEEEVQRSAAAPSSPPTTATLEGDSSGAEGKKKREVSPAVILQQLQLLRGDLGGVARVLEDEGNAEGGAAATYAVESGEGELAQRAKQSAGLLARLGLASAPAPAPSATLEDTMKVKVPSAARGEAPDGALEKRVAELELALGVSGADVSEVSAHPAPVVPTLQRLEHLLTLLTNPRHLDSISRRVKVLVSDLERIHDSRRKLGDTRPLNVALQGGMTLATPASSTSSTAATTTTAASGSLAPDQAQKLDALAALLPRLEPLVPLAPRLLARLRSLSALHAAAGAFADDVAALRGEVGRLAESEGGLREVLEGLEASVKDNEARTRANLESMERRVEDVVLRLEGLAA